MQSFFACIRTVKSGDYDSARVRLPRYREKGGLCSLVIPAEHGGCRIKDGMLNIPQSLLFLRCHSRHRIHIKIPPQLRDVRIKEIQIIPVSRGRAFKIQYVYLCEPDDLHLNRDNALAIDLGLDNLCACVSSNGATFLMDGRKIKSINHHYNKQRARLQAVYIKQKAHTGRLLEALTLRRNEQVQDIMRKTARYIINYCITHDIGTLIVGNNPDWKERINLGARTNQNFVQIPHAYLRLMLKCHCERYGMKYIEQEESYTSKASFIDGDEIPAFNPGGKEAHHFSGVRVKRGLYRSASGQLINADINGAANILLKCKHNADFGRVCKGLTHSPARISVFCTKLPAKRRKKE